VGSLFHVEHWGDMQAAFHVEHGVGPNQSVLFKRPRDEKAKATKNPYRGKVGQNGARFCLKSMWSDVVCSTWNIWRALTHEGLCDGLPSEEDSLLG
jgi:hypothetical protein